ncbi:aflatoxin biosynthesis ketoreductase nor-1 [Diaporthe helianthi]|uniref:Aflatoxin biosynthesis ketoreductase nor-1 n=1 Tax=Diaporthe helianthi TaxID=158607 RepID=A0A2P5I0W0_DIAHE|nr:aflatoxin biosynthesis ketoreductase nor-1 [Diaporthe helianthi]
MVPSIVLITGRNCGLGLGLANGFWLVQTRCDQVVITPVCIPQHETVKALGNLPKGEGSKLILKEKHGITHINIVLANAGGGLVYPSVVDVKRSEIHEHMELNVYSVVSLYQATHDLLKESAGQAQLAITGSQGFQCWLSRTPTPNAQCGVRSSQVHTAFVRSPHHR